MLSTFVIVVAVAAVVLLLHPDVTYKVDWVLETNYLPEVSVCLSVCLSVYLSLYLPMSFSMSLSLSFFSVSPLAPPLASSSSFFLSSSTLLFLSDV